MDVPAPTGSRHVPGLQRALVRDAMRPLVLTCDPATPMITVAQRLAAERVHALVLLADGGERQPECLVTDADVVRCATRLEELTAEEAATGCLLEASPDDRLADLVQRMAEHPASHALVTDPATRRPLGVVSTLDVAGILGWGRD
jgi:CBS-domain-containing membrane protein